MIINIMGESKDENNEYAVMLYSMLRGRTLNCELLKPFCNMTCERRPHHYIWHSERLYDHQYSTDIIITTEPLLMCLVYNLRFKEETLEIKNARTNIIQTCKQHNTINIILGNGMINYEIKEALQLTEETFFSDPTLIDIVNLITRRCDD